MAPAERKSSPLQRSFQVLEAVVSAGEPVGPRELSRRTGIARSTVSRILSNLAEIEMVIRSSDGAAGPGPGLVALTPRGVADLTAVERLRSLPAQLAAEFGESAAVGVDDGASFFYVVTERAPGAVQVPDGEGQRFPFHLVAPGLVAMAYWGDQRLERYLASGLEERTNFSVTDPTALSERLCQIRANGYAFTNQELDLEVNGVAVPIFGTGPDLVAVASLYGPAYRLSGQVAPDLGRRLLDYVKRRAQGLIDGTGTSGSPAPKR